MNFRVRMFVKSAVSDTVNNDDDDEKDDDNVGDDADGMMMTLTR